MIKVTPNQTPKYFTLNSFSSNPDMKNGGTLSYRYHQKHQTESQEKARAFAGSVIGTILPLLFFAKKQNKNIFKMKYGMNEIVGVSAGSIVGGVIGGALNADKFDKKQKMNEGIFQFINAVIPPVIVLALIKAVEKSKTLNNLPTKIVTTLLGITGGMLVAAKASNLICDPKDKVPDRKLTMKDSIANIDDALGAFSIANIPIFDKIIPIILPPIYAFCGYRAGDSN